MFGELNKKLGKNTIMTPFKGNGKSGVIITSRAFPEGTKVDRNLFKELRRIGEYFDVSFDQLLKHDELFELHEMEWSQEIFWGYDCDMGELLDVLVPLVREERLKKLLDNGGSSN
ncbi:MAG: hypothetical protein SLAVMIC_00220 [uncultured marine phage]|uniref:Uncharacterized protein n=1 Tax=uncultured marine phage TaxID=707152 RepID=A0A8D9CDR6_9VIRU|nr:MAG: hypothetical protein SLAVMIC_00220 [uncultured marine phage]